MLCVQDLGQLSVCLQSLQGVSFHHRPARPVRFHRILRLCLPIHRHASGSLEPYPVSYLKRKSIKVDLEAQTGCLSGSDGCAGYVPLHEPVSRITNNIQFSSCRIYRGRLRVVTDIPVRKIVQAPQSRYQRLLKGLTKYLQSCYI